MRKIPIFTFINKMDRPGREPLTLLDEIESELGLTPWAVNWPIGSRSNSGVIDRRSARWFCSVRAERGKQASEQRLSLDDPALRELVEEELLDLAIEEMELLEAAGAELDLEMVHAGELTPVFFGSAMTNFGVRPFLDAFLEMAQRPIARSSSEGLVGSAAGWVQWIRLQIASQHGSTPSRPRRICSRLQRPVRKRHDGEARTHGEGDPSLQPQKLFGQDRAVVEDAYPGDVIGLNNPGMFAIGDTLYVGSKVEYEGIPCFSPEIFSWLRNPNPSAFKNFRKGVNELREEGAVQILYDTDESKRDPILAAVGQLQLEVVQHRLENEYGVDTRLEPLGFQVARWVPGGWSELEKVGRIFNCKTVRDAWNRPVLLFKNEWNLNQLKEDHPDLERCAVARLTQVRAFSSSSIKLMRSCNINHDLPLCSPVVNHP